MRSPAYIPLPADFNVPEQPLDEDDGAVATQSLPRTHASTINAPCENDKGQPPASEVKRRKILDVVRMLYGNYEPDMLHDFEQKCDAHKGTEDKWLRALQERYVPQDIHRPHPGLLQQMQQKLIVAALSDFRGNEWRAIASESSDRAMPTRVTLRVKLQNPDFESHQTTDQTTGDKLALVLIAFHGVLQPFLVCRTAQIWNKDKKIYEHKRSITSGPRFIPDNMKFASKVFEEISEVRSTPEKWFTLHNLSKFFKILIGKALNQSRWEWKLLWLLDWEIHALVLQMIQCYVACCDPAFIPSGLLYYTDSDA